MKEETITKFEAAFEEFIKRAQIDGYKTLALTQQADGKTLPGIGKKQFTQRLKQGFRIALRAEPEPTAKQVEEFCRVARSLPHLFHDIALEMARKLPHAPGGRPRKLNTPEKRARLCAKIAELLPQVDDPRYAFLRAAAESRPPVSERTARRAWKEHIAAKHGKN